MSKLTTYFTKSELLLWSASIIFILGSFILFDRENYLTLAASLIGATSLIYCAKGNPFGQFLMVVFSIMYGAISYTFDYYGEMITYVGMTGPMALFALIAWLKNPYNGNRAEVKVNELTKREIVFMFILAGIVTFAFYFILKNFNTANLAPSTLSVTTSFIGVYLTFRRSAYYALAYALNDIILILLWTLATLTDISYMSVIICFVMFLVNDLYGFINWTRMKKTQKNYGKQIGIMIK
ncbi:MAG: nicotinamide riboside transporter PnuC [Lachnospiraceae bacterium]|nr:nicotinamide riboside transporter PnuC [Lachnospiraceae bacterium]